MVAKLNPGGGKPETPEETPETEAPSELACVAEGNQAYYYDSKRGYSLEFLVFGSTIEQLIKLDSPASPNTFTFKLDTEGVDLEKDEAGNLRVISQDDGRELFVITAPIMMDSNVGAEESGPAVSCDVSMDITKDKDGKANLTICADPAWLADPARVYPVYIDPAWTSIYPYYDLMGINKTNRGDTFCNSANPYTNFGSYYDTFVGAYVLKCGNTSKNQSDLPGLNKTLIGADVRTFFHSLYYFDLDGTKYNAGAIIDEAWLRVWCSGTKNCATAPIALEYPTGDWRENTTTWNTYPTVSAGTTFTVIAGACKLLDVTAKAQSWVKGTENGGAANRGFSLRMNSTDVTIGAEFFAREYGGFGPCLRVHYTMIGCPYNTDEVPTKFSPGETKICPVYIQNTGEETWKCDATDPANPYRLGFWITDRNGGSKQLESRVKLPRDVEPWETVCLGVPVEVPSTSGDWRINFGMVKEAKYWFKDKGVNNAAVDITVGNPPPDAERTASAGIAVPWMSHANMGGMSVNLVSGSTSFSATDLSVPGRGVPFGLSRTYASATVERTPAPLFGPNWFSGLDVKVKDYGNGYLAYYDASGRSHLLVQAKKANTFICTEGNFLEAECNPNYTNPQDTDDNLNWKYKVVGTGGVIQHFDAAGKLIYITDASRESAGTGNYKNKTKVNYDFDGAGNIQVVDASGRSCTITLSGGKISSLSEDASWANTDGHEPRTVSYEYNGPGGRLSKVTLSPGDHWGSITYSATDPNLITQTESKVDGETTRKSYFEYSDGKLSAYRNPRSTSSSDDTYKSTIAYNSGSTIVSSPQVSNYVGSPGVRLSTKYVFSSDGKGHTTDIYSGVNPDGSGGLGRISYAWNKCHQVTKVTDYQDLTTPLGSVSYVYDGKGNASKVEGQLPDGQTAVSTADYTASRSCSGNPTAATSPDGDKASLSYNSGENYMKGTDNRLRVQPAESGNREDRPQPENRPDGVQRGGRGEKGHLPQRLGGLLRLPPERRPGQGSFQRPPEQLDQPLYLHLRRRGKAHAGKRCRNRRHAQLHF